MIKSRLEKKLVRIIDKIDELFGIGLEEINER